MEANPVGEPILVLSTLPDPEIAQRLGRTLVAERLIACANLVPGLLSIYRWKGEIQAEGEVLMMMKTQRSRLPALKRRLLELHPYEVPELISIDISDGLDAYCRWVVEESSGEGERELTSR
jgi:periplasmic divalent cation tolerance protein